MGAVAAVVALADVGVGVAADAGVVGAGVGVAAYRPVVNYAELKR
jgi:hypothetical protein